MPPRRKHYFKRAILKAIEGALSDTGLPMHREELTRRIKVGLLKVGNDRHFAVYASGKGLRTQFHEWLWDVVWAEQRKGRLYGQSGYHVTVRLPMIAEIEWGTSQADLMDDFSKLSFGIADLRLFVFRAKNEDHARKVYKFCKKLSQISPIKREYLMIGVYRSGDRYDLSHYSW